MRRYPTLIVLGVLILVACVATVPATNMTAIPYIYRIKIGGCKFEPQTRRQSGFRVQSVKGIVTALHGVVDCTTISAIEDSGDEIFNNLAIVAVDIERDIALLSSSMVENLPQQGLVPSAASYSEIPRSGLRVVGYPLGLDRQDVDADLRIRDIEPLDDVIPDVEEPVDFTKRRSPDIEIPVLNLQAQLLPGHSGAPIIDSSDEVVGVSNGGLRGGTVGRSWAIPWRDVRLQSIDLPDITKKLALLKNRNSELAFAFSSTFPAQTLATLESATYTVHVIDTDINPVANAEVTLAHNQGYEIGFTDSEGFYLFSLPLNQDYRQSQVLIEANGYVSYRRLVNNLTTKTQPDEFRLSVSVSAPIGALPTSSTSYCEYAFRVLDKASSSPITDAEVLITVGIKQAKKYTDSTGYISGRLPCDDPRLDYKLRIFADGYTPYSVTGALTHETVEILLARSNITIDLPTSTSMPLLTITPMITATATSIVNVRPQKKIKLVGVADAYEVKLIAPFEVQQK